MGVFLFFSAITSLAHADDDILQLIQQNEDTAKLLGEEDLKALHQFRASVEKDAFSVTMKLCQGYRAAMGLPAIPIGHEHVMPSVEDSALAWGKVLKEGFLVSLSAIGGNKAKFNDIQGIELWNLRAWFLSMYTLYLINSPQFFYASQHCLNTVSSRDIFYFADAIVIADMVGTGAFEVASGEAIGATVVGTVAGVRSLGQFLSRKLRFVWRPYHYAYELLQKQLMRVRPAKVLIGTIAMTIAADNVGMKLSNNEAIEAALALEAKNVVMEKPKSPEENERYLRYMTLFRGYGLMQEVLKKQNDAAAQSKMAQFTSVELTPEKLALYHADEAMLKSLSSDQLSSSQEGYLQLLDIMRPLLTAATQQ